MVQVKKLESKGLLIQPFDTLTQKDLDIEPIESKNTIAEYLFPDSRFSSASFYKKNTPEQIEALGGKTLQFANVSKGYFSDTGKEREAIFPIPSDGAAYGSIPFTDCRDFHEVTDASVAIVDDVTGENPLGLEPSVAKQLVGDCYGQIDRALHTALESEENTPFQFRIGIKDQPTTVARIAKGTLSPKDLSDLNVDVVLAKSSFKGRKGEKNDEIEVGIYNWTLGVGLKTHAYRGEQSLGAQILVNYPKAVEALKPLIQERLDQLKEIAIDPTKLAKDYIDSIDRRYRFSVKNSEAYLELFGDENLTKEELDVLADVAASTQNEERFYHLIKADLEGHRQLLEHPAVTKVLNDHLRKQYVELATGRFAKFQGALLQPGERLQENEFCDSKLPDGAKVLVTRSPFINSNNLIELINRHLDEVKDLEGVVFMNPKMAASALQADFDGDRVAFMNVPESVNLKASQEEQLWENFMIALAAEVREKQLPQNRYADVIKKAKVPYTGTFPEVALSARENQIGTISRAVMKTIALENEIDFIPEAEKADYLGKAVKQFKPLAVKGDLFSKWLGDAEKDPEYHSKMLEVTTSLYRQVKAIASFDRDSRPMDEKLQVIKNFHHQLVGVLGNELQVAVDGPKSALRPEQEILNTVDTLTKYRDILWLDDYKSQNLYLTEPMRTSSYSPIDQMAESVNANWAAQQLQPRKTHQFRPLFTDISFTAQQQQKMQSLKAEHNRLYSKAHQLKQETEEYPGPRVILSSNSGKSLEVVGLNESKHPLTFKLEQMHVEIRFAAESSLKYAVFAEVPGVTDELGQPRHARLGYLSKNSEIEHGEKIEELMGAGHRADLRTLSVARVSPGLSKDDVKAAFNQVWDYDERARASIPESELESYAAAMWSLTHTRTDGTEASKDSDFRMASVAFGLFAPEIQSRLEQLQFKELTVGGVRLNEYQGRLFDEERLPISVEFVCDPNDPNQNQRVVKVDGKVLGSFTGESPRLPVGTTATATLDTPLGAAAIATLTDGETIRIGTLKNYPYAQTNFTGQTGTITIDKEWKNERSFGYVARLDGQILGEIKDKESKQLLTERNLLKEGTQLNVTLNREQSAVAFVTIDPDTVIYPDVQIHDRALSTPERSPQLLPTLWNQSEVGITMAVDNRDTEKVARFFDRYQVSVNFGQDALVEQELGYAVVRFESLSETVYGKLRTKFGEPLSQENYLAALQGKDSHVMSPPQPLEKSLKNVPLEVAEIVENIFLEDGLSAQTNVVPKVKPSDLSQLNSATATINIYTDGSSLGNPGPSGWAYLIQDGENEWEINGQMGDATGNQAELMAACEALKRAKESYPSSKIILHCDSQYLINTMSQGWKRKANHDLWEKLDGLSADADISWQWIKGHAGHPQQERVDRLARAAASGQVQGEKNSTISVSDEPTSSFKPTRQQQEALEKLQAWEKQPVSNDKSDNIFLLKGYAGTGKSYITSQWLSGLDGRSLVYTAPTHKALGVGRAMLEAACDQKPNLRTLQSLLKVKLEFNEQSNQGEFKAKPLDVKEIQKMPSLILVDEASMLDRAYWDTLKQLAEHGKKILLIGDDAQIRPVKGNGKSPVFSDPMIENKAELTEVVRYTTQQGYLATALRTEQEGEKMPIVSSVDGSVQALPESEWHDVITEKFTSPQFQENPHYFQIYAYTNERVDQLNQAVREKLWGSQSEGTEYVVGEAVVAKESINDPLTGNKAMDNEQEARIVKLYPPRVDGNGISCWLADVQLSTLDAENTSKLVTIKLVAKSDLEKLDKLLLSKEREYKTHPDPRTRSKLWKNFNEFKREYGKIEYSYAATFHAAQGSTKEYVAVDEQNLNDHFNSRIGKSTNLKEQTELLAQRNELLYVAVTRSRTGTFVFNQQAELAKQYNRQVSSVWYLPDELQILPEEKKAVEDTKISQSGKFSALQISTESKKAIANSIQLLTRLDADTVNLVSQELNLLKGQLTDDKSSYAPSRQRFWLGTEWDLKEKSFKPSGVWHSQLWELCQRIYPGSNLALITYSGDDKAGGINLHRDDSYAAFEARTLSIESNPRASTLWEMRQMYPGMIYTKEQTMDAPVTQFQVASGSVLAFNCKNPHAAHPGEGRWSINVWKVSAKYEEAYGQFVEQYGISGGAEDLSSGELVTIEPSVIDGAERRVLHAPPVVATIPWAEYGTTLPAQLEQQVTEERVLGQQVERSRQILPILIDYLKIQGKTFVQGETYTAFWDQANQTVNLIDNQSQEPILSAKRDNETWQPLPITYEKNGQITPRLQEKDVKFFLDSKPKIDQALARKQQQSQGRGR